jgi:capsular polysaccharide export protein
LKTKSHQQFVTASRALSRIPGLNAVLGGEVTYSFAHASNRKFSAVLAWGYKPAARKSEQLAHKLGLPLLRLEDGFLRSVGLGHEDAPLSIVVDDLGIYYDASRPSRLEHLIGSELSEQELQRARNLPALWRQSRVSKYNHLREIAPDKLPTSYVLVVDQTYGDASIESGLAAPESFEQMLQAALDENPDCAVLIKTHPDVFAGEKRGHFDLKQVVKNPRVTVIADDVHPVRLIEHAQAVYVVTSQVGFEALLWGKQVRTFGLPFYAGWGLTQDELPAPDRRKAVALEQLVHAALIQYPGYIDPETGGLCEPEQLIAWMGLQRRERQRFPELIYALGFSPYKRPIVRDYFQGSQVCFVRKEAAVPAGACLAVWGNRKLDRTENLVCIEDGFLRSVGLGADLIRPLSWVLDQRGIYYDASRPSELEEILQSAGFNEQVIARAEALRARIVNEGITKYNVGHATWQRPDTGGRRLILVPGQVESDASIQYGTTEVSRNIDLLRLVREKNPDAYIVYKPHPDVVAGLRARGQGEHEAERLCDQLVTDVSMHELLEAVDEVHLLTSLTGFEALLRKKAVTCYGQPFYAGWGLTHDIYPVNRRTRRLSLDELVAGVLILYPTYVSRNTGQFTTPERIMDELKDWQEKRGARLSAWQYLYRLFLRLVQKK